MAVCTLFKMCFLKMKTVYYILLTFVILTTLNYLFRTGNYHNKKWPARPSLIWWSSRFAGYSQKTTQCKHKFNCDIFSDRKPVLLDSAGGYLFYGSDFDHYDLPLPRRGTTKIWALLHEESPRNTPILSHELTLNLFNYSSTISRYSHLPLTLQYVESVEEILDKTYFIETNKKNEILPKLSPVLYIQSDCETSSYRDEYVKELMKYISIDSYGDCLNNKKIPNEFKIDYLNNLNSDEFLKFVSQYKFTIAIENGVCNDYISEKLWRPLKVGSVPIYMGSPSIKDWLPNKKSAIIISEFKSPKYLAQYIEHLNNQDDEYNEYLTHKLKNEITNHQLIEILKRRDFVFKDTSKMNTFIDEFECYVCLKVHEKLQNPSIKQSLVNITHYNCSIPYPPWKGIASNMWLDMWHSSKKESEILYELIVNENKVNFTKEEFEKRVFRI